MSDKARPSHSSQRQILDQARERLRDNDIDGYWALLARHDDYAGLARDAAANRGELGKTANARLERFAREQRGKPLDEAEREAIRSEVAAADLAQRERNLDDRGDHRISGKDSVDYHTTVFEARDIPKEAYLPAELQPMLGGLWGIGAGILLPDATKIDPSAWDAAKPFSESLDWARNDWKPIKDAPFREQVIENAKTLPTEGLMEIEGFHGSDAAPASQTEQKAARPAASSFATQFAALPPSPQRWLDVTLTKKPGELSEADLHALQAHDAYLQPQHPRRDETFRLVSDTYSFLYGDAPQPTDATGRPQRNGPLRMPPGTSRVTEAERRRSDELAGFGTELDRWKTGLGNDDMAQQRITGWLQRGLNELLWPGQRAPDAAEAGRRRYRGGPLLVDGLFGPVTADALDQAQANSGIALLQDRIGRIADDEGWQLLPA
ncbi:MAG: hypothetical protein KG075_15965 [Alphaproteobacteria bacterium]|nr:hypothetical protein [Alphaproteobacteria bacterium]